MTKKSKLAIAFALAASFALGARTGYYIGHNRANDSDYLPRVGSVMQNGTVYAGYSPDTHKPMYTTQSDARAVFTFGEAVAYCQALDSSNHQDWRVPTKAELNDLFNYRALIGGFNETGSFPAGWYWSSSQPDNSKGWSQRFKDGFQDYGSIYTVSSLRCVR